MDNKDLFIGGYISKLSASFAISESEAFEIFSIAAVLDRSFSEIYNEVIVRGKQDGGVDGVYFEEQGDYYIMHVFQCKTSKSLKANQIDKFRNDVRDVFHYGNEVGKKNIDDLMPRINEYKQLSTAGYIIEPKYYYLYNGENDASGNRQVYETYHGSEEGFEIWDSGDIYRKISSLVKAQSRRENIHFTFKPENSNVALRDQQALYSYSIQNVRATNFRIKARQLCELLDQEVENNHTYDFLFSENIRGYLGMRARANKKMSQTIDDPNDAIYFPFLNNGITIICKKLTLPNGPQDGTYLVPTVNPVIVNGLQTTRVVYAKYKEDANKVKDIYLNIRLYETDDPALVDKITDATNTQSPINFRDKVSNKDFNAWTKEVFALNDIVYITKRGETFSSQLIKEGIEAVNSDTVLKYWYATFYEKPEIAKNSISRVLEDVFDATSSESPLNKLFNGDKDSPLYSQLLIAYRLYQKVQAEKWRTGVIWMVSKHADELLCYGVYKYLENDFNAINDSVALSKAYDYACEVLAKIVEMNYELYASHGSVFYSSGYFKKAKSRVDYNREASIIERDNLVESLLLKS